MSATTDCQVLFDLFPSSRGRVALGRVKFGRQAPRIAILRELGEAAREPVVHALEAASAAGHPRILKTWGLVHDQQRAFVASEYVPAFCLAELLSVGRARQRRMSQAAAVRIAIQSLQLIEVARAALPGAVCRYLYPDCLWVADFGEVLLAEPGLASALRGEPSDVQTAAEAEAQDVMSVAMALFQLSTGRLLTGDIAAAVKQELSVPLARVVEAALLGSDVLATAVGLKSALEGLPSVLVGDDSGVTEALGLLAGDLIHERKAKLTVLTRTPGRADEDGPTRVYSGEETSEEEADEATVPLNPRRLGGPGRRVVRPATSSPALPLIPRASPPPARLAPPSLERPLPLVRLSLPRVERVLLYVLGALVALVLILSIARPERWRQAVELIRSR